jgi:hypothetical protein
MKKFCYLITATHRGVVVIAFTFVFLCSVASYAQEPKDLGVGTFTLQVFHYANASFSSDSTANIFVKRIYYVNHYKVLLKTIGPATKNNKPDTSKVTSKVGDLEIKSQMSARILYPIYLADYQKQQYAMYFEKSKKQYFFQDSLKKHPENIYKPKIGYGEEKTTLIVHENEIHKIAGKPCLKAELLGERDTVTFFFTREKLKFVSPLNLPNVAGGILGFYGKQKDGNVMGVFIIDIKDEQLPDRLFTIESTAQPKTWSEVMSSGS